MSMTNQNQGTLFPSTGNASAAYDLEDENRLLKKIKDSPVLPLATAGFLGIAAYRIYQARSRGGQKMSFFLIHTRLAAQGFGVAVLGSMVLYSLGQRAYNSIMDKKSDGN